MQLTVKKFGGASLATTQKLKKIAKTISNAHSSGQNFILVLSAMGTTTDDLAKIAVEVAAKPCRRELDMLISTGERVSISLMSIALNGFGCDAISFTGSQSGILTDLSHNNARILDVKPTRIEKEIKAKRVVVVAGFQGVCPKTKEITTLGRGGTDTTAVALAHYFNTECEMEKEVPGVMSADPKLVPDAHLIESLSYEQLINLCFWGAKVCHVRAAELAKTLEVPLSVGRKNDEMERKGTMISNVQARFEEQTVLSVNSHPNVAEVEIQKNSINEAMVFLNQFVNENELSWPQVLDSYAVSENKTTRLYLTAPLEHLSALTDSIKGSNFIQVVSDRLASVTATCSGATASNYYSLLLDRLHARGIQILKTNFGSMSVTVFVDQTSREKCIRALHDESKNPPS